ncbi:Rieske (2Fe-2S) protein [Kocuria sp. KSNUG]|uniref:Rieske (2Fe-2S) protein n=1 Tax=Kocuria TaxID=57493 RepID=UPI0011A229FF|nr:Rieske (2Fe-2S) protein [Kocuria rhizophila]
MTPQSPDHDSTTPHGSRADNWQDATREASGGVPTRRRAVGMAGVAAAGALALSACGSDDQAESTPSPTGPSSPTDVGAASEIPVGSGMKVDQDGLQAVVGHPQEGTFTAYSPVCPHQGCTVNPAKKQFVCPCHSSAFDMATGDVTGGPAESGLSPYPVKVENGRIIVG